jgi:8-oxo-dGTP diphosphatase
MEKRQESNMDSIQTNIFGGKVRVRVCAVIIENNKILLLKHDGIGEGGFLWSPPGGGVEFGENITETLNREVLEETGVEIETGNFLFFNEYIDHQYHAIELFFKVKIIHGEVKLGFDPELSEKDQIIKDLKWFDIRELNQIKEINLHNAFRNLNAVNEILEIEGFFKFRNISIK